MKKYRGATIRNTKSTPVSEGMWFTQKEYSKLQYSAVYQKLDELTLNGYTALQIEEILNLGEEAYKKR